MHTHTKVIYSKRRFRKNEYVQTQMYCNIANYKATYLERKCSMPKAQNYIAC